MKKLFLLTISLLTASFLMGCSNGDDKPKTYTVTWLNDDMSILEVDNDVHEGTTPSYDGEEPSKSPVGLTSYTFSGWSPAIQPVSSNVTYVAQFNVIENRVLVDVTIPENSNSHDISFGFEGSLNQVDWGDNTIDANSEHTYEMPGAYQIRISGEISAVSFSSLDYAGSSSIEKVHLGNNITAIPDYAFYGCSSLADIEMANTITSIGESAFADCDSLSFFQAPTSLLSLGESAFADCNNLVNINLFDCKQLTEIANATFTACSNLNSIAIPDSVVRIGDSAFAHCTKLADIIFGEFPHLQKIGKEAFSYIDDLRTVFLPVAVNEINEDAFSNCENLKEIYLPKALQIVGKNIFKDSAKLGHISIFCETNQKQVGWDSAWLNDNASHDVYWNYLAHGSTEQYDYIITKSGAYLRHWNEGEGTIVVPSQINDVPVIGIGGCAFYNLGSIESVIIPNTVVSIGNEAFAHCRGLTQVQFAKDSRLATIGSEVFSGCISLEAISIPDSVTSIGEAAFSSCGKLASIQLGSESRLNEIKGLTFSKAGLTSINIPRSVTKIDSLAFSSCDSLATINFPLDSHLLSIGSQAFINCSKLTNFVMPLTVTYVGGRIFLNQSSQNTVYCRSEKKPAGWDANWDVVNTSGSRVKTIWDYYNSGKTDKFEYTATYHSGVTITKYFGEDANVIVDNTIDGKPVTSIGEDAFYTNKFIESVVLPDSLTYIRKNAFRGCSNLNSVQISSNADLIEIADGAFMDCSSLKTIALPNFLETIGQDAFKNCCAINEIILPASLKNMGVSAFYKDNDLSPSFIYCNIEGKPSSWPRNWQNNWHVFWNHKTHGIDDVYRYFIDNYDELSIIEYIGAESVTDIVIPNEIVGHAVKHIDRKTFEGNQNVKSFVFPSTLKEIGYYACSNCTNLETVFFNEPSQLDTIDSWAFSYCSNLHPFAFPSSLRCINSCAFAYCTSLSTVYIPSTVTSMQENIFYSCSPLEIHCAAKSKPSGWWEVWNADCHPCCWDYASRGSVDGFDYYLTNEDELFIIRYSGSESSITIPSTLADHPVSGILSNAFAENESVTSVIVPDGLAPLLPQTFANSSTLESVTLPSDLTVIDNRLFVDDINLKTVNIPDSVSNIEAYAFSNCQQLVLSKLPKNLTQLGNYAFQSCTNLTSVTAYEKLYTINKEVFSSCTNLEEFVISSATGEDPVLNTIGDRCFYVCSSLKKFKIPLSLEKICAVCFYRCISLTELYIPNNVITIESNIFDSCSAELQVYCQPTSKPSGWFDGWSHTIDDSQVHWGVNPPTLN